MDSEQIKDLEKAAQEAKSTKVITKELNLCMYCAEPLIVDKMQMSTDWRTIRVVTKICKCGRRYTKWFMNPNVGKA